MVKCPQCALDVSEIRPVEVDVRYRIKQLDANYPVPDEVCRSCMSTLRKKASGSGGLLMAQERAKDERKVKLWKSRTGLVKQGHTMMANHFYSEAAISYEKYLKLLEICFECPPGGLKPQILKEAAKTTELTVIAGVYWDLVRVYDTSDQYGDRQKLAAKQLSAFLPYTPIFADLIKKAAIFQRHAKHPEVIKSFLASARTKRARCFIATSAFEIPLSNEVQFLRQYRDEKLKNSFLGRKFVLYYYFISPSLACFLDKHACLKPFVRAILRIVIKCVS